jgi:hypothetical protein
MPLEPKVLSVEILSGWKEIANYLHKGVRTVQRYERELGLPIRRPSGGPAGSVIATKAELDAWVAASPIREVFRLQQPRLDFTELRKNVADSRRLHEESSVLRNELRSALTLLYETLQIVANSRSRRGDSSPVNLLTFDPPGKSKVA